LQSKIKIIAKKNNMTVIEKKFKILSIDKKNANHRTYTSELVKNWINNPLNNSENPNEGFSLEYAIDEGENERDIYKEFTSSSLECGIVKNLEIVDGILYADIKLKLPDFCNGLTEKIYSDKISLEEIAIVPKGKGSVKNQIIQNDYELFGFNLILLEESAFSEETELEVQEQ
jgi:hypothetical protein